jgi:two-component system sensor histidine kinase DctS
MVDAGQLREIFADVGADGRRAYDIIETVRGAIKKGNTIRCLINLNDVVRNATHMLQPDAAVHCATVETSLADNLPVVHGDPTQMHQVLINLVRNAFDSMRDTPVGQRTVEIATECNGEGVISVGVRDHGVGIPAVARERLFEQFFTTKEEGLGMGLAIVRSIIQNHGGRITAENAPGGGAHFSFTLPIVKESIQ